MDDGALSHHAGCALPRAARITDSEEIRALFRRGKRRKTRHLDVFVSTSPVAYSRIGLVVPKPRAKTAAGRRGARGAAVQRNLLKRRLREIARTTVLPSLNGGGCAIDLLIRARPEAYAADYGSLKDELMDVREWMCSSDR
jgi:ribonuclease P protein component